MIQLIFVESLTEIQDQRELYMNELPYSQDLNAEENVWESQYYKIIMDSVYIGYFCVDSEKTLWEFYLIESALMYSQEVFKFFIDMNYIVSAECKTYDHLLMSLCFDFHKKAACSIYLFRHDTDIKYSLSPSHLAPKGPPGFIAFLTILKVPFGVGVLCLPTNIIPT
jgi:hypothetical protein